MKFIAHLSRKLKGKKGNKIQYFCSVSFLGFPSIWFLFTYWGLMKFEKLWFDIFSLYFSSFPFYFLFILQLSLTISVRYNFQILRSVKNQKILFWCVLMIFVQNWNLKNKQIWFYIKIWFLDYYIVDFKWFSRRSYSENSNT